MVSLNIHNLRGRRVSPPPARNSGITRVTAVILVLTAAALVLTAIPFFVQWREDSASFNCSLSVEKMQDLVDTEVLFQQRTLTPEEMLAFLEKYKEMGEILCPDGGEFDAVERDSMSMEVVCCRHDADGKRRVRLCAERVLERVQDAVWLAQLNGDPFPDQVKITLNSRSLTAKRVDQATGLRRGTSTVKGYQGIVAFYALAGQGDGAPAVRSETANPETASSETASSETASSETASSETTSSETSSSETTSSETASSETASSEMTSSETASSETAETDTALSDADSGEVGENTPFLPDGDVREGEVWYLSYADEDHAATWTVGEGWRIDGLRLRK